MKKVDLCRNRLHRNLKQKNKQAGSKFQMIFLICAESAASKSGSVRHHRSRIRQIPTCSTILKGRMEYKRIRTAHSTQCTSRAVVIVLVVVNSVVFWPKNDKNRPVSSIFGAHKMCHFLCTSHFMWHFRAIFWNISILLIVVQFFAFGFAWLVAFESGSVPPSFISTSCAERVPISKQIRFACMRARFSSAQATHQNREKRRRKDADFDAEDFDARRFFFIWTASQPPTNHIWRTRTCSSRTNPRWCIEMRPKASTCFLRRPCRYHVRSIMEKLQMTYPRIIPA